MMHSPRRQSATTTPSSFLSRGGVSGGHGGSLHAVDSHGAVRKRTVNTERARASLATAHAHADRLHQLALEQQQQQQQSTRAESYPVPSPSLSTSGAGVAWITPHHSPDLNAVFAEPAAIDPPCPTWTVPTPPRSDSGVPSVSVDLSDEAVATAISAAPTHPFDETPTTTTTTTTSAEMSSLEFLLPHYGASAGYVAEPSSYAMDQNYAAPTRLSQPAATSGTAAYASTMSSSPALYQSKSPPDPSARRISDLPSGSHHARPAPSHSYRRISNPYDSTSTGMYSMSSSQTIPSISGNPHSPPLPSPHGSGAASGPGAAAQYNTSLSRSPSLYESSMYSQAYTTSPAPAAPGYAVGQSLSYPPPFVGSSVNEVVAKPLGSDAAIRVLNQRPKPQCWEHGCNGRQFSTFSNLLRHQREKSGTAAKSYCPKCGAEFTRTTARNGHLAHDKCQKQRRQSDK